MVLVDTKGRPLSLSEHNNIEHSIGEEIPAPTLILPSAATASLGSSAVPAREDHVHSLNLDASAPIVGYTPSTSGITSFGSFTAYYQVIGRRVFVTFQGITPVFSGTPEVGLPSSFLPVNTIEVDTCGSLQCYDATGGRSHGYLYYNSGAGRVGFLVSNVAATYEVGTVISSTIPFTWTTNDRLEFSVNYRY